MKKEIQIDGNEVYAVLPDGKTDAAGNPTGTQWSMGLDQAAKHDETFQASGFAKADRDAVTAAIDAQRAADAAAAEEQPAP